MNFIIQDFNYSNTPGGMNPVFLSKIYIAIFSNLS